MDIDTRLVRFDAAPDDPYRPTSTPIHQTATFEQEDALGLGEYDYSRTKNPTRSVLETQLARLEGGARALAYSSGMAAIAGVLRLLSAGDHVVAGRDLYGGTQRLLGRCLAGTGVEVSWADATDAEAVRAALRPGTRLIWVETPSNPLLEIADLRALARVADSAGALLAVDNTMLSPYLQRPLELGADIVVQSATKHLSGHGDVTAGAAIARDPDLARELAFVQNAEGTALGPFDAWLLLRGLKTLSVRLERAQEAARDVAELLASRDDITAVHYPGLDGHRGKDVHFAQASGAGSVLSFETGSLERSRAVVEGTELFTVCVSFGSVASSISLPCRMSHASVPAELANERPLPADLVRISTGIEKAEDLTRDLERALDRCRAPTVVVE